MKIYYSHPTYLYGTQRELENIDMIEDKYPGDTIINPKDIVLPEDDAKKLKGDYAEFLMMQQKYYFPVIKECDIFVYEGNTHGVELELKYAKKLGKEIRRIDEL